MPPIPSDPDMARAATLNRALTRLARRYHLRDRDEICCHGVTVAQCYALQALAECGAQTMRALAEQLGLQQSTVTRTVDPLVRAGLVHRFTDPDDRRCCRVAATPEGEALVETIVSGLVQREHALLERIEPAERDVLVRALETLVVMIDETTPPDRCC